MTEQPTSRQPLGPILDSRGVTVDLPPGHLVGDVVVLIRVLGDDGGTYVKQVWTAGMDWVSRRGLIEVARDTERIEPRDAEDRA